MIALQLARIVMDMMRFVEFASEDLLHPDAAIRMRTDISRNLRLFDKAFLHELIEAFGTIASEYTDGTAKLARDIPSYLGLEHALIAQTETGAAPTVAMQAARLISDFVIFLDQVDDDLVDPDAGVTALEGLEIDALDKGFLRQLVDAFPIIANDYEGEERALVRTMAEGFFLEEKLAEGDPARLAELDALREAKD